MVRLCCISHQGGKPKLAAQLEGSGDYCDLSSIAPNVRTLFTDGDALMPLVRQRVETCNTDSSNVLPSDECKLLAPMNGATEINKFVCIGMNYRDHCTEQNVPIPEQPVVFSKFGSCVVGPNVPVAKDPITEKLDYEVELGIVIGKTVPRNTTTATSENCLDFVGGYTVILDVSARDWQLEPDRNGGQWLLGKAMDGYAPMGPVLVTPDELEERVVHNTGIRCRVNGQTLQESSTSEMIHKTSDIIGYLSKFMTLYPGDVIATGTPPGVGCFRTPPVWLQPGDVVECEIDGIGTLVTPIVAGPLSTPTTIPSSQVPMPRAAGKLAGMNCIVTGGARGLGYGIAARLGLEGASRVTLVDLDPTTVQEAAQELQRKYNSSSSDSAVLFDDVACDVTDLEAVQSVWSAVASKCHGRIDILVQAAGIVGATNVKTEDVDPDDFDAVFRVNVRGIFNGCKVALKYMKANQYGRIVNIASIAGKEGNAGMLAYSSSKAAVIGLTKTIGKEYAAESSSDITCNALAPAVVRTQMVQDMPPAQVKYMTDKIPMKRCGTIEEIASMVAFMVSPEASFTTGFCFDATGGRAVY